MLKKLGQVGDTIVEVMLATAILGFVMGIAYNMTSKALQTSRASQERLEALKFAEGQVEYLKSAARTDPDFNNNYRIGSDFCFKQITGVLISPPSLECEVGPDRRYKIKINYLNDSMSIDPNKRFGTFNIRVDWNRITGGEDQLIVNYQT